MGRQIDDGSIRGRAADVHHDAVVAPGLMRHTGHQRMRCSLADVRRREGCRRLPRLVPCTGGTPCHGLVERGPWCVSMLGVPMYRLRVRQRVRTLDGPHGVRRGSYGWPSAGSMPHLGGRNGFQTEGIWALPHTGLLRGAAGHKMIISSSGLRGMSSGSTDLEVNDSNPLPAMPETTGRRRR